MRRHVHEMQERYESFQQTGLAKMEALPKAALEIDYRRRLACAGSSES
jgi:hypothetical protein